MYDLIFVGHFRVLYTGITILFLLLYQNFGIINPIAVRRAKIVYNFGLSECN